MIDIITGPMFAGKTEELIRRLRRAEIAGKHFVVFKSQLDDRYAGIDTVCSHGGLTYPALPVPDSEAINDIFWSIYTDFDKEVPRIIAIDEAQFLDEGLVEVVDRIANLGIQVIIVGLDTDYTDNPFGPMPALMAKAENVQKLSAVCMKCGGEATKTFRKTEDIEQIKVGEKDTYEARCRHCWCIR
jgi:thymidine kinase